MSRPLTIGSLTLAGLVFAGCATYRAKPLTTAAVDEALAPPPAEAIRVSSTKLHHPLLKPIDVDGRDGFTPDEIAVMAVIASPKLRALRDQRGVAEAQVIQAGLLPNPQLGYSLDRPHGNADPTLVTGNSLGLSWEATSLLGYRDRLGAGKNTARALDLDIAWQEWQAAQEARLTAYRILSLEERLPLAQEAERQMMEALTEAKHALDRGYRTAVEVAAMVEATGTAQDARFAAEQELTAQRLALNLALGQPATEVISLTAGTEVPEFATGADTAANLLQGFEQRRLDLVALTLGYESAEATLRTAVRAQFPKIGLSIGRARDTSDVRTHTFGVTIDLPLFDRGQGQIAVGRATRQQLFDEYVARVAEARSEVVKILGNLAVTRSQLQAVERELPGFERLVASLDQAMRARNTDVQAWRDAHNTLLSRRTLRAKLRQDLVELAVALEIATGNPALTCSSL
jgi:outer membrane protein TolC